MSQRNPGRRGFFGEGDGSDSGDSSDTSNDGGSGGTSDGGRSRSGIGSGVRGQPGGDPSGDGGSGDDGGGGGTGGDGRSRSGIDSGVTGQPGTGGEGDDGGTADDGTADDGGRPRSGIGSGVRGQPGADPSDDGGGGDGRSRSGIGSGVRGQPGVDPADDGGGSTPGGQTSPPRGRAPPSQRGDAREPADRVPGDQPSGFSGDPNPTGGIGADVPARARGEARDLRQEAADQWQGAVGPEDIMITYDDADQQLEATLTESGVREITARDNPYADFEDVTVSEAGDGFDVSLSDDARLDTAAAETEYSRDQLAIRDGSIIATGGAQQQGQETPDLANPYEDTDATVGASSIGQTTDPDFDPDAEQSAGIGEVAADVVQQTVEDPGGYVGGGAADFAAYVGADLTRGSAQAIDSDTTERIADTETFIPSGAVDRLQDAGAFIAEGSGEQESGIAGAYQDAGGLQGIGETAAGGLTEAAYTIPKAASGLAEEAGVPGAGRVRSGIETVQTGAVEPALSGALGDVPAGIAQAPGTLALVGERGVQTGEVLADDPSAATDVGRSAAGFAGLAGVGIASSVAERPARSVGSITGEVAVGSAAVRGLERGADAARGFRTRRQASDTVELEDITSERGAEGELPEFETDPDAPTEQAVAEVRTRTEDVPESVQTAVGSERALFHSTDQRFGSSFDVGEGSSELPGLFMSPETSPIGLYIPGDSYSGVRAGLPQLRPDDRIAAVPGKPVEAMPESATGSGYAVRQGDDVIETGLGRGESRAIAEEVGGEPAPDPTTSGYEFLTEEAETGTSYVRPSGSRSSELEAVAPPDTAYEQADTLAVRIGGSEVPLPGDRSLEFGGRTVPLDVYRRPDSDVGDVAESELSVADDISLGQEIGEEISQSARRAETRSRTPIGGPAFVPSSSPESDGGTTSTTVTGTSTTTAPTSAPTSTPSVSELTGTSTGESSAPSLPFGSSTPGGGSDSGTPITPPPSSGGSGSGSTPTPSTGVPRAPEPSLDFEGDEESFGFGVAGGSEEEIASFFDPLSGELNSGATDDSTLGW